MTTLSFVEKVRLAQDDCVMLYRGISLSGKDFFAYLRCDREGLDKLRSDSLDKSHPRDISEYGEVIYIGLLADPDAKAEAFLERYLLQVPVMEDAD